MLGRIFNLLLLPFAVTVPMLFSSTATAQNQFTDIEVSTGLVCGITTDSEAFCTTSRSSLSLTVSVPDDLPNVIDIAGGNENACAITVNGDIRCFGADTFGLLNPPTAGAPYSSLAMNTAHACAINRDNGIDCWGVDSNDRLNAPAGTYQQVSVSTQQACAVDINGGVACWGSNDQGTTDVPADLPEAVQVSSGSTASCALLTDGSTQCWGVQVPSLQGPFTQITTDSFGADPSRSYVVCGLDVEGSISCESDRTFNGQVQPSSIDNIPPGNGYTAISSFSRNVCAINSDGEVECFGTSSMANPLSAEALNPIPVTTGLRVEVYSETTVELFWDSPSSAFLVAGHEIQRNGEIVAFTQNLSSFILDDLEPGESSTFAVRQISVNGTVGTFSDSVDVTPNGLGGPNLDGYQPPERPFEPTGLEAFVYGETTVELIWDRVSNVVTGYEIRRDGEFVGFSTGTSFLEEVPSAAGVLYRYDVIPVNQNDLTQFLGFASVSVGVGGAEPGVCL